MLGLGAWWFGVCLGFGYCEGFSRDDQVGEEAADRCQGDLDADLVTVFLDLEVCAGWGDLGGCFVGEGVVVSCDEAGCFSGCVYAAEVGDHCHYACYGDGEGCHEGAEGDRRLDSYRSCIFCVRSCGCGIFDVCGSCDCGCGVGCCGCGFCFYGTCIAFLIRSVIIS
ncbi:hypothetical protein H4W33_005159 [Kibdelosporangium phytohabitans]|nr:hypothetical protein [Kibdelosporangium phytohabitans]